ncbi:MAG: helix-turn-helix domain-containing protein [Sphingobium sp.]|nr:helix-turn-helix domain-containing protein [Sphingobium sp.]
MIERKVKMVRALERGLQVLAEIERRQGANLHELHLALGLPKATLLRMVVTLGKHGHIWQRLADGAFLPSYIRAPYRPDALHQRIAEVASRHLIKLSEQVAWPSVIAVPRLDHVEVVETNSTLLRLDAITLGPVGSRLSYIHTSTGRAYLAFCDAGEREAIIERLCPADDDGSGRTLLDEALAETRERGYALREPFHPWPDRDWQAVRQDGRRSIAVPVMMRGKPVAALNVTWLVRRTDTDTVVGRHLNVLKRTAETVSAELTAEYAVA